ncbi:MAG: LPS export ABC transporter periplasmic protein LptC [Elusimicrobia bacterium RIFCSPLOWO2_12_FULL_59_9]|nr:MAG: LPS export ABC transporter periplasmic protein LptC [Elusimicrobia bacterium RIFCSPLOWO2_12_FULL_59_9]
MTASRCVNAGGGDRGKGGLLRRAGIAATGFFCVAAWMAACSGASPSPKRVIEQRIKRLHLIADADGKRSWELRAVEAELLDDPPKALLTEPQIYFFKNGARISQVSSRRGEVFTSSHDIHLSSAVVFESLTDSTTLRTDSLRYSSKRDKIFTQSRVAVTRPGGRIDGQGLEAAPDLSEIRIKNQHSVISR